MKFLITGGTGLIGSELVKRFSRGGNKITVLSRNPSRAAEKLGQDVTIVKDLGAATGSGRFDVVINLAGEPIVGRRWSEKRKKQLWDSRVTLTEQLVQGISASGKRPSVLVSGSAIGYYGDCGDRTIDENSPAADDFGARLCQAWEEAAVAAEQADIRTCRIRTGLVLSGKGGMLGQMLLPFKFGLGSRLGSGNQWMSWIHIDDQLAAIESMVADDSMQGAYNLTAPAPVTNREFTRTLARVVRRPAFLVTPAFAIKAALGESAHLLLGGQKVLPGRLSEQGFSFRYADLNAALESLAL